MQLRYAFRVYPDADQRGALAGAFGCARVVDNDALRARGTARANGGAFPTTGELSTLLITRAKKTEERSWSGEVSSVVLQQARRDLDAAYRDFPDSIKGTRLRTGPPRFKPRKDSRQSVRFTADAQWKITEAGEPCLPKVGGAKAKWSRALPSAPSTVTLVEDAAGRYVASFVVETDDQPLPETPAEVGTDLGLGHFAVLSDGVEHFEWLDPLLNEHLETSGERMHPSDRPVPGVSLSDRARARTVDTHRVEA